MKKIVFPFLLMIWFVSLTAQSYTYTPTDADRSNTTERIVNLHADIEIQTDGNIVVTVYVTLYSAGIDIKRGIVHTIQEYRMDKNGKKELWRQILLKNLNVRLHRQVQALPVLPTGAWEATGEGIQAAVVDGDLNDKI